MQFILTHRLTPLLQESRNVSSFKVRNLTSSGIIARSEINQNNPKSGGACSYDPLGE